MAVGGAHLPSSRPKDRERERNRASAASVLLVLRGNNGDVGGGMADAGVAATSSGATEKLTRPEKQQLEQEERRRFVHEITESSSDESSDEGPDARTAGRAVGGAANATRAVIPTSPPMDKNDDNNEEEMEGDVVVQEYYPTRNVADMHYLFTNDRLKEQPATVVLRSDPFCIPRVTDNVSEYRPRFNPLSILEAEEKLLPGYFRLDPTEGVPGADKDARHGGNDSSSSGSSSVLLPLPSAAATSNASGVFIGKSTAFMGSMPRQQEFMEFPISENIFHSFKSAPAPPPTSPHPGLFASKLYHGMPGSSSNPTASTTDSSRDVSGGAESPAALADAVLLSSMQHAVETPGSSSAALALSAVGTSTGALESIFPPSASSLAADGLPSHLQPVDSAADTLTNYLPARQPSVPIGQLAQGEHFLDDMAGSYSLFATPQHAETSSAIPSLFVDDVDSSVNVTTTVTTTATTPQHDPKTRSSLQPVTKKPRAKNVFRPCTAPGCTKGARGKSGLCQRHGGGRRCAAPNCPKGAQGSSNMCLFHGGGYRCTVEGCMTGARGTSGLCAKHGGYKRSKDSGAESGAEGGDPSGQTPKAKRTKK